MPHVVRDRAAGEVALEESVGGETGAGNSRGAGHACRPAYQQGDAEEALVRQVRLDSGLIHKEVGQLGEFVKRGMTS